MKAVAEIDEVYKSSNLQVVWESRNDGINSTSCFWFNSGWVGDLCFAIQPRGGQFFLECWRLPFILSSVCLGGVPGALFYLLWWTWEHFSSDVAILNVQEVITFLVMEKALLGQKALSYWASAGLMMPCCSQLDLRGLYLDIEFLCFYFIFEFDSFGVRLMSLLLKSNSCRENISSILQVSVVCVLGPQ